jgi:hypothetical protein
MIPMSKKDAERLLRQLRSLASAGGVLLIKKSNIRATLVDVELRLDSCTPEGTLWKLILDTEGHADFNKGRVPTIEDEFLSPDQFHDRYLVVRLKMVMDRSEHAQRAYDRAVSTGETSLPYEVWLEQTVGEQERRMTPVLPNNRMVH